MTILKEHVSYSEVKQWKDCPWRHKLLYIDKIGTFEESPHLHYGTIMHDEIDSFAKCKKIDIEKVKKKIVDAWDEHGFDSEDYIQLQTLRAQLQGWKYKHSPVKSWLKWAEVGLTALPDFLDETFPDWEFVSSEESLYESTDCGETKFKGYIDCIIRVPHKGKYVYWILDWKTANGRGWSLEKQRDFSVQSQVILYKNYWQLRNLEVPIKDIKCGFVLIKKVTKPEKACQLIKVSSGPKSIEKANKMVRSMITNVTKGFYLKNKNSCMFCEFHNTDHCR